MKPISTVLLVLLLALPARAADTSEVQRAVEALSGLEARFTQSYTPKGFKKAQVERGTVVFGNAPRMRWSYEAPEQKSFVFDGTTSWFYVPAERQVTVNTLTDEEREGLPFLFLSDAGKISRSYSVKQRDSRGLVTATLTARSASLPIASVAVTFSRADHLLRRLEYTDRQGNRTVFELSAFSKARMAPDSFRFSPPPGTEIVEN